MWFQVQINCSNAKVQFCKWAVRELILKGFWPYDLYTTLCKASTCFALKFSVTTSIRWTHLLLNYSNILNAKC
jgi:hypothetical protein